VRPVGGQEEVLVDVRILSATHKDLRALVASGQFREDLFYRVNVIELNVPPLRERTGDVEILTQHMLTRLSGDLGVDEPILTDAAKNKLAAYSYPGNVRELENILERALALSGDAPIAADDIMIRQPSTTPGAGQAAAGAPATVEAEVDALGDQLESVERRAIIRALEETRYNKTAAARQLGLTLRALRYRIQKLGIE
jgi:two-component system response regulator PilR (NtrC family)